MGSLWLPKLADWLRAAGLTVVEYQGWLERSRSSGGFDDILAIGWHHDAAGVRTGQRAADAHWRDHPERPCGNLALDRSGVWWVGAAGAANTQGKGGPMQMSRGTIPLNHANERTIAVEAANNGVGEVWPQAQLDAYVTGTAAIIRGLATDGAWDAAAKTWRRISLDPTIDIIAHFEWAPTRKIDPAGPPWGTPGDRYMRWDMDAARARVAALLASQPSSEEDDMTTAVIARFEGFANAWLIGSGAPVHLTPALYAHYTSRGVPEVLQPYHDQLVATLLHQCGLTAADLVGLA